MSPIKKIMRNMSYLTLATIISKAFGFLNIMLIARYLGPENYGILAFALAIAGIFGVLTNVGIDPLMVREVARKRSYAKKYLVNGIMLKAIFWILTFGIVFIIVNILRYPPLTKTVVYIVILTLLINSISNLFRDVFQAYENMKYMALAQILGSGVSLLLIILFIFLKLNVIYFAMAQFMARLIVLMYYLIAISKKYFVPKLSPDTHFWKEILKDSWPFVLSSAFVSIYFWADSIMISAIKGNLDVGFYYAAYRLVYILLIIPQLYFTVMYPVLSRLFSKASNKLKIIYVRSLRYFIILGIFIGVSTDLFSKDIIYLIYGANFLPSVPALSILIWAISFSYVANVTYFLLNSINKQVIYTKITALAAVSNILLNFIAIPYLSYIGASITTVLTEGLGFILMFYYLRGFLDRSLNFLWLLRYSIVILVMITTYILITKLFENATIFQVCVVISVYVIGLIKLGILDDTDKRLIRSLLKGS